MPLTVLRRVREHHSTQLSEEGINVILNEQQTNQGNESSRKS